MGPLSGIRIVEMAGIGPAPMAAMMLADMGAQVLRIERQGDTGLGLNRPEKYDLLLRGRKALALDLKQDGAIDVALRLIERADGLIEGFRPGVMERLGLGPEVCLARNPALVFGRMTGWGQDGPLAQSAGHDLNYIALTGALDATGRKGQLPAPPLNLLGDYAGGGIYLAFGMVCAMLEARQSGKGQVVDAAIVDGAAHLTTGIFTLWQAGLATPERGGNVLDSGAYFYDVYPCADGKLVSVAPIEGKFHARLLELMGVDPETMPPQSDKARWDEGRAVLAAAFRRKTRAQWCALLEGTDACFAPVLSMEEAPRHPHMRARDTYLDIDGVTQPAPAPRFSRTRPAAPTSPRRARGTPLASALDGWMSADEIAALRASGLTVQP